MSRSLEVRTGTQKMQQHHGCQAGCETGLTVPSHVSYATRKRKPELLYSIVLCQYSNVATAPIGGRKYCSSSYLSFFTIYRITSLVETL